MGYYTYIHEGVHNWLPSEIVSVAAVLVSGLAEEVVELDKLLLEMVDTFYIYIKALTTGCPISKVPLCFGCFRGFPCSYRGSFYHFSTAQEMRIPKLALLSSLRQKLIKSQSKT